MSGLDELQLMLGTGQSSLDRCRRRKLTTPVNEIAGVALKKVSLPCCPMDP